MLRFASRAALASAITAATLAAAPNAAADPSLRVSVDQRGDFAMFGNTMGFDCGATGAAPIVGTVGTCGLNTIDTAPDVYWTTDDQAGTATANNAIGAAQIRSTANLSLPAGATVTHAFLYYGGDTTGLANIADLTVTLDRPDGAGGTVFSHSVNAIDGFTLMGTDGRTFFHAITDVTAEVAGGGAGAYRLSGLDLASLNGVDSEIGFAAWTIIVLYEDPAETTMRNLTIFDGLDNVSSGAPASGKISGFLVPNGGFDAKLGVFVYEGEDSRTGDSFLIGTAPLDPVTDALSNALNPADNFFNGSHSHLGAAVSVAGDLPQLAGTADTMGGVDIDVIDITPRLAINQTEIDFEATSSDDAYMLGAFVTSISTFEPDLKTSTKEVVDIDGGALMPGDEMTYTIVVNNTGNDTSVDTVVTDVLPSGVTYKPDSLVITAGANAGAKTDATLDDQAEFDASSGTVTVRVGTGANATDGGTLAPGESTTIQFVVVVNAGAGDTIANQAEITASGQQGAPESTTPTDGNGGEPGAPSTDVVVDECEDDTDCGGANSGSLCNDDYECEDGCTGTGSDQGCPDGETCTSTDDSVGTCEPDGAGGSGGSSGTSSAQGGSTGVTGSSVGGAMPSGTGGGYNPNYATNNDIGETGSCACELPGGRRSRGSLGGLAAFALGLGLAWRRRQRG